MTKESLQRFCVQGDGKSSWRTRGAKYLLEQPYLFTHPKTGKSYTFATDGHRMVIVDGHLEGCERDAKAPNIESFIVEPAGALVDTSTLKTFLECDKPSLSEFKCQNPGCDEGVVQCICPKCNHEHEAQCSECGGTPRKTIQLVKHGWLGHCPLNRALLTDAVADVADESVRVLLPDDPTRVIHLFASDRHIAVMPMSGTGLRVQDGAKNGNRNRSWSRRQRNNSWERQELVKEHRCTRFKQTGSLQFQSLYVSITREGKTRRESVSADTVQVKCVKCGATQWLERKQVLESGKVLLLKTEER